LASLLVFPEDSLSHLLLGMRVEDDNPTIKYENGQRPVGEVCAGISTPFELCSGTYQALMAIGKEIQARHGETPGLIVRAGKSP
jgi:hypothetical protein